SGTNAAYTLPGIRFVEGRLEIEDVAEIFLAVTGQRDQEADLDQGVDDAAEVLGPREAPVRKDRPGKEPEALACEVTAGPGELRAADVTAHREPRLHVLDARQHEEVAAFVE